MTHIQVCSAICSPLLTLTTILAAVASHGQDFWTREAGAANVPFDPFEPKWIETALRDERVVLGPLIFGRESWVKFCAADPTLPAFKMNRLVEFFETLGDKGMISMLSDAYHSLPHSSSCAYAHLDRSRPLHRLVPSKSQSKGIMDHYLLDSH